MNKFRKVFLGFCFATCNIFLLCTLRTYYFLDQNVSVRSSNAFKSEIVDKNASVLRFAEAVKFSTIAWKKNVYEEEELLKYVHYIIKTYDCFFQTDYITYDIVNGYSLLITVKGSDDHSTPYMLMGHLDVVPFESNKWSVDPFSANIKDGKLFGRGAMDCKLLVMGILEALKQMVENGYRPKNSFYIAFGHDEEVGGENGAGEISKLLERRNVKKLMFIVDEGMPVLKNFFPGIQGNVATIGVAEKGLMTANISVEREPGHSSIPPAETSIGIIARALLRLENSPQPKTLDSVTTSMLESLGKTMSFPLNVIFTNIWLFKPLITVILGLKPESASLIRTTTAVTMVQGGTKTNVLPSFSWATINFRIHPSTNCKELIKSISSIINDERVKISMQECVEPSHTSPHNLRSDLPYQTIYKTYRQLYEDAIISPGTLVAMTDTRHYTKFTKHVFRQYPAVLTRQELKGFHGHDEHISFENFFSTIKFYDYLIRNIDEVDFEKEIENWSNKSEL